jgi:hypothetical protein
MRRLIVHPPRQFRVVISKDGNARREFRRHLGL